MVTNMASATRSERLQQLERTTQALAERVQALELHTGTAPAITEPASASANAWPAPAPFFAPLQLPGDAPDALR